MGMRDHILELAQERATLAAAIEDLETVAGSGTWTEQRACKSALHQARRRYHFLEQSFQNATATLSDKELAAIGVRRAA